VNLVVDGIPAIPASLADDVRRYTESRRRTSPTGIRRGGRC
jgi:hypothetical protein